MLYKQNKWSKTQFCDPWEKIQAFMARDLKNVGEHCLNPIAISIN